MLTMTREELIENIGKICLVTREKGKYRVRGKLIYQSNDFIVWPEDEQGYGNLRVKAGDEIEVDGAEYRVDLTE